MNEVQWCNLKTCFRFVFAVCFTEALTNSTKCEEQHLTHRLALWPRSLSCNSSTFDSIPWYLSIQYSAPFFVLHQWKHSSFRVPIITSCALDNGSASGWLRLFFTGSPERLYESVHERILSLPSDFLLFPAHDYKGQTEVWVWSFPQPSSYG